MLVFEERGNRSTRRKTSRCRVENQQTQLTYEAESGNRTRATLVGGESSHHGAIPAGSCWCTEQCSKTSFGNLTPFLCKTCWVIFYCFVHQHGSLITWMQTKNCIYLAPLELEKKNKQKENKGKKSAFTYQ